MDKNNLISVSRDNTLRLWDLKSFECVFVQKIDFGFFIPLVIDEQFLYTYSPKLGLILWSWKTRKIIKKIKCDLGRNTCSLAVDNTYVYCCPYIKSKKEWGIGIISKQTWKLHKFIPINKLSKECSRIIIDRDQLYALCLLDLIEVNLKNYEQIIDWNPINEDVYSFSLDSQNYYIGPFVISRKTRQHIATLLENNNQEIHHVKNDNDFIYLSSGDLNYPYVTVWQKNIWKLHQKLSMPIQNSRSSVECVIISENYVYISRFNEISIWAKKEWQCVQILSGHSDWITNLIVF